MAQPFVERSKGLPGDTGPRASVSAGGRLDHLDLLRGVAALLVLAGHARALVFANFESIGGQGAGLAAKGFYFLTGLGHQAVIIFFALSGFLVGGKALDDMIRGRFSWTHYMFRRFTRLWLVLLPALFLTLALDTLGLWLTGGAGYDGRWYSLYILGPREGEGIARDAVTFFGNIAFLQTLHVRVFGSNGPMWSLANEFWYYVFFPLLAWLVFPGKGIAARLAGVVALAVMAAFLPVWLLEGGLIWVAGAIAAWCAGREAWQGVLRHSATGFCAVAIFCVAIAASKLPRFDFGDVPLGLVVAATLPALARMPSPGGIYRKLARAVSEFSFTLYVTHFPLLLLIAFPFLAPVRVAPGVSGALIFLGLTGAACAWAAILWWCFERHTDRLQKWMLAHFARRTRATQPP